VAEYVMNLCGELFEGLLIFGRLPQHDRDRAVRTGGDVLDHAERHNIAGIAGVFDPSKSRANRLYSDLFGHFEDYVRPGAVKE